MSFGTQVNLIHPGTVAFLPAPARLAGGFHRRFAVDLRPWSHLETIEASIVDAQRVTWTTDAGLQMDEIDRIIGGTSLVRTPPPSGTTIPGPAVPRPP